ncbi:MAG: hypothetical protein Q4G09_08215, partial [Clostridia bacterium]|nr:hypothetical protein [Clostridia bacterium]
MEEEKYQVNIPAQVKTRIELINGIGIKEIINTAIAGVISIVLDIPIYAITKNYLVCVIVFAIITGLTFICVMKDKNNISVANT